MIGHDRQLEIYVPELSVLTNETIGRETGEKSDCLTLLARADHFVRCSVKLEECLLTACGITAGQSSEAVSTAALLACHDRNVKNFHSILCCDPVFLRSDPSRLMLFDVDSIGINETEATSLVILLNDFFQNDGLHIWFENPGRWFVDGLSDTSYEGISPKKLAGIPLEPDIASRKSFGSLASIMTEAQMVLHECEINKRRADGGKPPVNSIWLWGGGGEPFVSSPNIATLFADDIFSVSCAKFCGVVTRSVKDINFSAVPRGARGLVVIPPNNNFGESNILLQTVIAHAINGLKSGELTKLVVTAGRNTFLLDSGMLRRFWKRKKTMMRRITREENK